MTLLLSFLWRRREQRRLSSTLKANNQDQFDLCSSTSSSAVPEVTTSASGETMESHCLENNFENRVQPNTNTFYLKITSPPTPEGLRPRKSPEQIREELQLPTNVLDGLNWLPPYFPTTTTLNWSNQSTTGMDGSSATTHAQLSSPLEVTMGQVQPQHLRAISYSSDWNKLRSCDQSVLSSPQISTSSFYSRSTPSRVAQSPNLMHAKTAVGAVIAMVQPKQQLLGSSASNRQSSFLSQGQGPLSRMKVLPPRGWIDEDKEIEEGRPYQALCDDTPVRRAPNRSLQTQSPESSSTVTTVTSSNHASPSSNYNWRRNVSKEITNGVNASFSSQIGLISDRRQTNNHQRDSYNFNSILTDHEVTGLVVESDHVTTVSAMSQSSKDQFDRDQNSDYYSCEEGDNFYYSFVNGDEDVMERALRRRKSRINRQTKEQLLLAVVERLQDDRQLLEDLQQLNRHDKPKEPSISQEPPRLSTNYNTDDQDRLFCEFEPSKRVAVLRQLDSILNELIVAQPEEFFLSPSQMNGFTETHDNLRQALSFVRTLVMRVENTASKNGNVTPAWYQGRRWRCRPDFRVALGIEAIPQSPESIRGGGDTSVFSLPSEENTPHTSNVSMTTTITTYTSPLRSKNYRNTSATNIGPTLELVSTLLQKVALVCHDLIESTSKSLRAAEQLKQTYLKLVSIPITDIRSLVNAFELEYVPPQQITRQVSVEDEEGEEFQGLMWSSKVVTDRHLPSWQRNKPYSLPLPPPQLHRSILPPPIVLHQTISSSHIGTTGHRRWTTTSGRLDNSLDLVLSKEQQRNDNENAIPRMQPDATNGRISLPGSMDTLTLSSSENDRYEEDLKNDDPDEGLDEDDDVVDDLRRQVGSNDYDDHDIDARDGPEEGDDDVPHVETTTIRMGKRCAAAISS